MLNKLSLFLANRIIKNSKECLYDIDIYVYGIEIFLSTIGTFLSVLLIAVLFSDVKSAVVFLSIFVPLRLFTGGYHADSYMKCFATSNMSWLGILTIKNIVWKKLPLALWFAVIVISEGYIWKKAPIQSKNQPLNEKKKKRCKITARIILMIDMVWISALSINNIEWMCMAVLSNCLVALLMMVTDKDAKKRRKGICV